jgi:hypothetical protein
LILLGAVFVVAAVVVALSNVAPSAAPTPSAPSSAAAPAGPPAMVWPAPSDPLERTVEAGLEPGPQEYKINHVHAHLDVFIDGKPVIVPAGIGINIEDPEVRRFENPIGYGGIKMCAQPCISPLHTHDETGIIHTESSTPQPNTLGEFFVEWGVELSETCVGEHCPPTPIAAYIDGQPYQGDPGAIELTDQKVIVIAVGTPPAEIPSTADFSAA